MAWLDDKIADPEGRNAARIMQERIESAQQMRAQNSHRARHASYVASKSSRKKGSGLSSLRGRLAGGFLLATGAALALGANNMTADANGRTFLESSAQQLNSLCGDVISPARALTPNGQRVSKCF